MAVVKVRLDGSGVRFTREAASGTTNDYSYKAVHDYGLPMVRTIVEGIVAAEKLDAIVTGMNDRGTWVRILHPVAEGRLDSPIDRLHVCSTLRVRLVSTNVERGFIDFKRVR